MKKDYTIGILLGGGISNRGKLPYDPKTRAKKALKLFRQKKIQKLILSGKASNGNPVKTEAKLYLEYLMKKGVGRDSLILEEQSSDTITNAIYSKELILREKLPKKIILITSKHHLSRALMIFKHIFGKNFNINGVGSNSIISFLFINRLKELEKRVIDDAILLEVSIGNHKKAKSLIKKLMNIIN